jgi:hypothetical protein
MPNQHIAERLASIREILNGVRRGGMTLSAATKGNEREAFIDNFLNRVLPDPFRFGTGDATDVRGRRSGQLDVVIEYPLMPSLPLPGAGDHRLYLADGIAAVIEVKSDLTKQWDEVLTTARQLGSLEHGTFMKQPLEDFLVQHVNDEVRIEHAMRNYRLDEIPFFVVGYTGWKNIDTVADHLNYGPVNNPAPIHGILVIDAGLFASALPFGDMRLSGDYALWGLVCCLHNAAMTGIGWNSPDPARYLEGT